VEVKNQYGKSRVVVINVGQNDVDGILINWDLKDNGQYEYMENEFISKVMNYLPEYAFGYDTEKVSPTEIVEYLRDAAQSVVKIKKVNSLGYPVRPKYNGYEAVGFNLGNSLSLCYPRISQAIIKKRDELAANTDNWDEFCPLIVNAKDFM
jgi:hypothetical protein